ncbi:methylmalonyl-CoA mutase family protein [Flammeovirgaceae bacterium SG7u.111]|nr:methylmalonyl-CoA mutase family protein [Flammeovirgaceae bacterium SG7u.132]WPO37718.1 methylmalonyl-CoA mutase family protein [Flammeovirgaceae bacterium SG7u.111]
MQPIAPYQPTHKIRIVTAASLFDGHDVSINLMRRIMQASGAEVIHLGHNRSVKEIVECAIQEDVQAIAITSYQGGHLEFFKYAYDLLQENDCGHIKLFGGGGGTIHPQEIEELHQYGITKIFSPDDGRELGLQGMINVVLEQSDFPTITSFNQGAFPTKENKKEIAKLLTAIENEVDGAASLLRASFNEKGKSTVPVLGITGTGGAGKSSLTDELIRRFLVAHPSLSVAIVSVDPTRKKSGGALLGDRIRMNAINNERVFMRSMATRQANFSLSKYVKEALDVFKIAGYDLVILESSGIGQSDSEITEFVDVSLYVMTPEFGAPSQLEKIDMLDFADVVAINKFDKQGSLDALRDVRKQYQRNRQLWDQPTEKMPVFGTVASQFYDEGTDRLFAHLSGLLGLEKLETSSFAQAEKLSKSVIIPSDRVRYLSEISKTVRDYNKDVEEKSKTASSLYALQKTAAEFENEALVKTAIEQKFDALKSGLAPKELEDLESWSAFKDAYEKGVFSYQVRGKDIKVETTSNSLAGLPIRKVSLPKYKDWGDLLKWQKQENVPGVFPYTAGVFPFKRKGEDPARMFAGEGGPERTNKRFHYVSEGLPAKRLSTAFDSVTLYGKDPDLRPDIYGKIGNSGVSIASLDDAKKLYSGFNLADPSTSVSMTINGPAAAICAYFMNVAIDQQCELYIKENSLEKEVKQKMISIFSRRKADQPMYQAELPENHNKLGLMLLGVTGDQVLPKETYEKIKADTLRAVRGTVQADILKEDQAQNTCIFSTGFSLRLMGDMQQYFIQHKIKNFYSVSISGYHIAEAGANPITQLAFTLANGFTYVEYYLSRGMDIDDFAPNLSFFFSNGIDPEYAVIGRVARRIWAKAMKLLYGASDRSQKLKYHIQTSGRSLHAQEIDFNDIRTTLQALYAIYDNCNSLHTNAYDEAITTPTEESVRRALAIQLIINKELGLAKNQNPLQGSFVIEELTELVEEAVMAEFDRLTERGGVIGAMEAMYQRSRIQEESMYYEHLKHNGDYPIIGVNTFLSSKGSPTIIPQEVIRSTEEEKNRQVHNCQHLKTIYKEEAKSQLAKLQTAATSGGNVFEALMEAIKVCTLGQLTDALFAVGGQYRRNM